MTCFFIVKHIRGFTLVELMVAMFLSTIVSYAVYRSYVAYCVSLDNHDQTLEMQQNLRVSMNEMVHDIRMAGCDPLNSSGAGFETANDTEIKFNMDREEDGNIDRTVEYKFDSSKNELEQDGVSLIQNVSYLEFVYLDTDRKVLTTPVVDDELADIRIVQICLVVRTGKEDFSYTDTKKYENLPTDPSDQPDIVFVPDSTNNHYHRRVLNAEVKCRNMGL